MVVGKISLNANEVPADLQPCYSVLVAADAVCQISVNDNSHYQDYLAGEKITLTDSNGISKLYAKSTGVATVRYWGYN